MLGWIAYKVATYAFIPACTYIGTTIGTHVGLGLVGRIWRVATDKLRGVVNVTLKRSRTYIVHRGEVLEIDPRKRYIILRGELLVEDIGDPNAIPMDVLGPSRKSVDDEWHLV